MFIPSMATIPVVACFAAGDPSSLMIFLGAIGILVAIVAFSLVTLLANRYKRCPSNRVLVIYGKAGRATKRPPASTAGPAS